ncbi:MAG TPA: glycosyltransferase family 4 protein [Vicinamibacterales bacterium]|nr:glycosyltransferase family 4 protein [Vicinamibacterales bacterium]
MRVLILSIYHDPEPIPKTGELARELRRRGHDVTVVTAFPHYPSGRLYAGYRLAPWRWEMRDGVRILRTFIYPYHGKRGSLRIVNYLTWMLSSIQASWLAPACDVLYVWHPPLSVGVSAWVIAKLKRVRYVYDVQDLWPESALVSGLMKPGPLVNCLYRLADWVYARAPRIFVVSRAAAEHLRHRGVDPAKMSIAQHWVDTGAFQRASSREVRAEYGWQGRFVVMFAGNLGLVQGLETIIEAAALVPKSIPAHFVFVGDGADRPRLEQLTAERRLGNVQFIGPHPAADMPDFLRAADGVVVHLRPSGIANHAIPTKILSYLAAAKPILCAAGGASAELVREADAGLTTDPGDVGALAAAIGTLASMKSEARLQMGERGRQYLFANFEKERVIDFYERALMELAERPYSPAIAAG